MKTTWILIANASQARLFKLEKKINNLQLIKEFDHPESRSKVIDLIADGQGRYRKSARTPKSAYQEQTDPKQVEAIRFAHTLVSQLEKGRLHNLYNNLILIAPSHFQGLLNKCCNHHLKNKISCTLTKDYTKIKEHDLSKYLNGVLIHKYAA